MVLLCVDCGEMETLVSFRVSSNKDKQDKDLEQQSLILHNPSVSKRTSVASERAETEKENNSNNR